MKKLLLTLSLSLVCAGAFAQGKILFQNDVTHLVYFSTDTSKLAAGDTSIAGRGVYKKTIALLAGAPTLYADLYLGTSADSLTKVATTGFTSNVGEGLWVAPNVTYGNPLDNVFAQVVIRDSRDLTASASATAGHYSGVSTVFQFAMQATYSPMYAAAGTSWAAGSFNMDTLATGDRGAIEVSVAVPEPASFALAGLGAAALVIFRRRK